MGYYPAFRKKETVPFVTTGMNQEDVMLNEISQSKRYAV